jgi:hypothetical protein
MIKVFSGKLLFCAIITFAFLTVSTGYSQKKKEVSLNKDGVKLEYKYPAGKSFKYATTSKIVQDMNINGQSMLVNISIYMGCQVMSAGKAGENLNLKIKMDSLVQNVESPQGSAGGSVTDIKNKEFTMLVSPSGKTIDNTEASKIVYNLEGIGENNLAQEFLNFFPSLPENPVKPGDKWIANDTIDRKAQNNTLWMSVASDCKFEGIEKIDGIDCARITASLSGTRKMNTQSQGMDIFTSGPYTGTFILLFALEDGYFFKESVDTKLTGNIEIPSQNMTFPLV